MTRHLKLISNLFPESIGLRKNKSVRLGRVLNEIRAKTEVVRRIPDRTLALMVQEFPVDEAQSRDKPRTRGECPKEGPCPWVSCKWNLYLDVTPAGNIKYNFPDKEIDEIPETCALRVADKGGECMDQVGIVMNLTRQRVQQIQEEAFDFLSNKLRGFEDHEEQEAQHALAILEDLGA